MASNRNKKVITIIICVLVIIFALITVFACTRRTTKPPLEPQSESIPISSPEVLTSEVSDSVSTESLETLPPPPEKTAIETDHERLILECYQGIFVSMFDISNFEEADFHTYRGLQIACLSHIYQTDAELSEAIYTAVSSDNPVTHIYVGLDPANLQTPAEQSTTDSIFYHIENNPNITFEILFSFPDIQYWQSHSPEEQEELLTAYRTTADTLLNYSNVTIYFVSAEEWLLCNPNNYTAPFTLNKYLSQRLLLLLFCDGFYKLSSDNIDIYFERLESTVSKTIEPLDMSDWCMVFIGDSNFANYPGSTSIEGIINGLTNATVYNCSEGGTYASNEPDSIINFPLMAKAFVDKDINLLTNTKHFNDGLQEYINADHTDRKLCFFINFGLNDYFVGNAVNADDEASYTAGLTQGIRLLQETYPEAYFLLLGPSYNIHNIESEKGGELTEYVDAATNVADALNISHISLYHELGVNELNQSFYLEDGCHFSEAGRFLVAEKIITHFRSYLNQ